MTSTQSGNIKKMRDSKEYKNYKSSIEKVLKIFENTEEWPDLISVLGKLQKLIQTYSNIPVIPRKFTIGKRLAQCLHPALPSGVHLKTLQIYDLIFETIGSESLYKDSSIYLCGIYPLFSKASLAIKPFILELYEKYLLQLYHPNVEKAQPASAPAGLQPAQEVSEGLLETADGSSNACGTHAILVVEPSLMGLFLGTFPGIDPGSENLPKFYAILNAIYEGISDRVYFFESLWTCIYSSPSSRLGALNYLLENKGRFVANLTDAWHNSDRKIIVRALGSSLRDNQLLVRRTTLDILNTMMPLDKLYFDCQEGKEFQESPVFSSLKVIMYSVLGILLEHNAALNKRVLSWIFSSPSQKKLSLPGPIYLKPGKTGKIVGEGATDQPRVEPEKQLIVPSADPKRHKRTGSKDDTYYLLLKRSADATLSMTSSAVMTSSQTVAMVTAASDSNIKSSAAGAGSFVPDLAADCSSSSSSSVTTSSSAASRQPPLPTLNGASNPASTNTVDPYENLNAIIKEREYAYSSKYAVPLVLACWRSSVDYLKHLSTSSAPPNETPDTALEPRTFLDPFEVTAGTGSPFLFLLTLVDATETSGGSGTVGFKPTRERGHRRRSSTLTAKEPFLNRILATLASETIEYAAFLRANPLPPDKKNEQPLARFRTLMTKRGLDMVRVAQGEIVDALKAALANARSNRENDSGRGGEGDDKLTQFLAKMNFWTIFTDIIMPDQPNQKCPDRTSTTNPPKAHLSKTSVPLSTDRYTLWSVSSCVFMETLLEPVYHQLLQDYPGEPTTDPGAAQTLSQILGVVLAFCIRTLRRGLTIDVPEPPHLPPTLRGIFERARPTALWVANVAKNNVYVDNSTQPADNLFYAIFRHLLVPGPCPVPSQDSVDDGQVGSCTTEGGVVDLEISSRTAFGSKNESSAFDLTEYDIIIPAEPSPDHAFGPIPRHNGPLHYGDLLEKVCVAHYYFYVKYVLLKSAGTSIPPDLGTQIPKSLEASLAASAKYADDFNLRLSLYTCMLSENLLLKAPEGGDCLTTMYTWATCDVWKNMLVEGPLQDSIPTVLLDLRHALRHDEMGDDALDVTASRDLNSADSAVRRAALVKINRLWAGLEPFYRALASGTDRHWADIPGDAFLSHTILSAFAMLMHKDLAGGCWDDDRLVHLASDFVEAAFLPAPGAKADAPDYEPGKVFFMAPILRPLLVTLAHVWEVGLEDPAGLGSSGESAGELRRFQVRFLRRNDRNDGAALEHNAGLGKDSQDSADLCDDLVATHSVDLKGPRRLSGDSDESKDDANRESKPPPSPCPPYTRSKEMEVLVNALSSAFYLVDQYYDYHQVSFSLRIIYHLLTGTFTQGSLSAIPHILLAKYPVAPNASKTVLETLIYACLRLASSHYASNSPASATSTPSKEDPVASSQDGPCLQVYDARLGRPDVYPAWNGSTFTNDSRGDLKFSTVRARALSPQEMALHNGVRLGALRLLGVVLKTGLDFRQTHPRLYEEVWEAVQAHQVLNHVLSSIYLTYKADRGESVGDFQLRVMLDIVRYNGIDGDYRTAYGNHLSSVLLSLAFMSSPNAAPNSPDLGAQLNRFLLHDILVDVQFKLCLTGQFARIDDLLGIDRWVSFMELAQFLVTSLHDEFYAYGNGVSEPPPASFYATIGSLYHEMVVCLYLVINEICHTLLALCRYQCNDYQANGLPQVKRLVDQLQFFLAQSHGLIHREICYGAAGLDPKPKKTPSPAITPKYWQYVLFHEMDLANRLRDRSMAAKAEILAHADPAGHYLAPKTACALLIYYTPLYLECFVDCVNTFPGEPDLHLAFRKMVESHYFGSSSDRHLGPAQAAKVPLVEEANKTFFDTFLLACVLRHVTMLSFVRSASGDWDRSSQDPCERAIKPLEAFYLLTVLKQSAPVSNGGGSGSGYTNGGTQDLTYAAPSSLIAVHLVKLLVQLLKNPRLRTVLASTLKTNAGEPEITKDVLIAGTLDFLNGVVLKTVDGSCLDTGQLSYIFNNTSFVELLGLLKNTPFALQILRTFHVCLATSDLAHPDAALAADEEEPKRAMVIANLRDTFQKAFDSVLSLSSNAISSSSWILFKKTAYVVQLQAPPPKPISFTAYPTASSNVRTRKSGLATSNGHVSNNVAPGGRPNSMGEVYGNGLGSSPLPNQFKGSGRAQLYSLSPGKKKKKLHGSLAPLPTVPYHPDLVNAKAGQTSRTTSPLSAYLRNVPQQSYSLEKLPGTPTSRYGGNYRPSEVLPTPLQPGSMARYGASLVSLARPIDPSTCSRSYQDAHYFPSPTADLIMTHKLRHDTSSSPELRGANVAPPPLTVEDAYSSPLMMESFKSLFDNFVATYPASGPNPTSTLSPSTTSVARKFSLDGLDPSQILYYHLISPNVTSYVHFLALDYISKFLVDIMNALYNENNDKAGVGRLYIYTTLIPILVPYLKERRLFNVPAFEVCSQLLYKMSLGANSQPQDFNPVQPYVPQPPSLFKLIRKEVWDLFSDPNFFHSRTGDSLLGLGKIVNQLLLTEPSYFKDLLSHLSPINTSNSSIMQIFTRADAENKLKILWLKKLAFAMYCGSYNQYENNIPEIQEKLVEYVTHSGSLSSPPSPDELGNSDHATDNDGGLAFLNQNISRGSEVLACSFLCFRVLLIRVNNARLASLWPVILNESSKVLREVWNSLKRTCSQFMPLLLEVAGENLDATDSSLPSQMRNLGLESKRSSKTDFELSKRRSSFRNTTSSDILRKSSASPAHSQKAMAPRPNSLPVSPSMALSSQAPPTFATPLTHEPNHSPRQPKQSPKVPTLRQQEQLPASTSDHHITAQSFEILNKLLGGGPNAKSQSPFPPNVMELLLSLCRLLDVAFVLPPDTSLYFQSYVWSFINYECYAKPRYRTIPDSRDVDGGVATDPGKEGLEPEGSGSSRHLLHQSEQYLPPASVYKATPLQKISDLVTALCHLRDEFDGQHRAFPKNDARRTSWYSQDSVSDLMIDGLTLKGTTNATQLSDILPFFSKLALKDRSSYTAPPPSREFVQQNVKLVSSTLNVSAREEKGQGTPYVPDIEAFILEDFCEGYEPND